METTSNTQNEKSLNRLLDEEACFEDTLNTMPNLRSLVDQSNIKIFKNKLILTCIIKLIITFAVV